MENTDKQLINSAKSLLETATDKDRANLILMYNLLQKRRIYFETMLEADRVYFGGFCLFRKLEEAFFKKF